jgi:hypothetical protein
MDAGRSIRLLAVGIDIRVYSDSPLFRKWETVEFVGSLFRGGVPHMFFYKPFMGALGFDSRCEIALADGVLLKEGPLCLCIVTGTSVWQRRPTHTLHYHPWWHNAMRLKLDLELWDFVPRLPFPNRAPSIFPLHFLLSSSQYIFLIYFLPDALPRPF